METKKEEIASVFPYFDKKALDSGRFLFGLDNSEIEFYQGDRNVIDFLAETDFENWEASKDIIQEGNRNDHMSRYAGRVLKRLGNTDKAYELFFNEADKCSPALLDHELDKVWNRALNFWKEVSSQEGYIQPEDYDLEMELDPEDYSDVGQAMVLAKEYKNRLRYSPSTDFLVYNGSYWEESKPKAQALAQDLTFRQLEEAELETEKTMNEMKENGALDLIIAMCKKKAGNIFTEEQRISFSKYEKAIDYKKYAIQRRDSRRIASGIKEVQPMLEIEKRI